MIFQILLAVLFLWLIFREVRRVIASRQKPDPFDWGYLAVLTVLLGVCLYFPLKHHWREKFFADSVSQLVPNTPVSVDCSTAFESIFDQTQIRWAGYTYIETGHIVFKGGWCDTLESYLENYEAPSERELWSLNLFTHEAMHTTGERNEQKTECMTQQRNHLAAEILGIPSHIARQHAKIFYTKIYPKHPYFSEHCTRGGAYDENIDTPIW